MLSPAVEDLVTQLSKLPGIGRRTAQRLAFHILSTRPEEALELARAIEDVKSRVRFCRECGNLTEDELCGVCSDERRDRTIICVVEQPVDVVSLERTGEYRGLYHVLGVALSPLDGVEPTDLRIDGLLARVARNGVTEVVLATNPTMTGEATAAYLADRLRDNVQVTRLASGLPVPAHLGGTPGPNAIHGIRLSKDRTIKEWRHVLEAATAHGIADPWVRAVRWRLRRLAVRRAIAAAARSLWTDGKPEREKVW